MYFLWGLQVMAPLQGLLLSRAYLVTSAPREVTGQAINGNEYSRAPEGTCCAGHYKCMTSEMRE